MIIPPEKIVELLNGSAGGPPLGDQGRPGELALSRREIASGLGVDERSETFRELIRAMTAAGYLRRVRQGSGWVYILGRPLDDPDRPPGPAPGFTEQQTEDARREIERLRQTPRGARPYAAPDSDGKVVHGVVMRPTALCGRDVTDLRADIPLRPGADLDLLNQRETYTLLVEDATCRGCILARDRTTRGAPRGRRPGTIVPGAPEPFDATAEDVVHGATRPDVTLCFVPTANMPRFDITRAAGTATYTTDLALMTCAACLRVGDDPVTHGLLPEVTEFTACGEVVGNLHNPRDTIITAGVAWPEAGSTVTCHPCRDELAAFDSARNRRRDADKQLAAGLYVHLADGNGNPMCPIQRVGLFLPEGHSLTTNPNGVNCTNCIDANGGHRGYRGAGYNEGRAAAEGDVDTSRRPDHNYVQGLAAARAETYERWLAAARAQYTDRCTFNGAFNSEHQYENDVDAVARSKMGNGGYDEWERCEKHRDDALHLGDGDAVWLAELFEFEVCHECGQGADRHRVRSTGVGGRFAECVDETRTPMAGSDDAWTPGDFGPEIDRPLAGEATEVDGRCEVSEREIGTPHSGPVRAYRASDSNGRWLVCDGHVAGARERLAGSGHSAGLVGVVVADDEQAAHDAEFFRRLFAERPCQVCGAGPEGHRVEQQPGGYSVPVCINPPAGTPARADAMAGPCTFYGFGFNGPHAFVFDDESRPEYLDPAETCGQPRSAAVHIERGPNVSSTGPAELESLDVNAHELRPAGAEEGFSDYREGRRDYANEQVDETRYGTNGDYAQGVRDEYVIAQRRENEDNRAPAGWTPPEPRWTARTFENEPPGTADEAEEAWRHRVERIDHWRRTGRLSDREATALLAPMSPGAVIAEEEAWRRNGTAGRFDPDYAAEVERLSLDADNGHGVCRYCGEGLGREHAFVTGPDGRPVMEHAPWDYTEGHGTRYDAPSVAAAAELVPGDPVRMGDRNGIFEYLDDDGQTAHVTFEGQNSPERVPAGAIHAHGGSR